MYVGSLTESFDDYDLRSEQPLKITWAAHGNANVHLRVNSLKRRLYYRMDTEQSSNAASYIWPHNLLAALNITRQDIGLVGWMRLPVGGVERTVLLPLRVSQEWP